MRTGKKLLFFVPLLLAGCSSNGDGARSLFDRLEFGPDECGEFEISGTVDTSNNPFVSSNIYAKLSKQKKCEEVPDEG